jgi:3-isopropylmalate/(R)-2-methylmalate dehydratase large subunit
MEFTGPGASTLSVDGRAALCGMAMFTGATSAIFNPDELTLEYARKRANRPFDPVWSDPGAEYSVEREYDLCEIEPQIVIPPSPRNTRPMEAVKGTKVQQGYIGSCVSGRIEDFRAAAEILEGRMVKKGFRLYVIPSSNEIARRAEAEGLVEIIRRAGGEVHASSCDFCFGHSAALSPGEACISTGVLNIPGRMGSAEANIFMGSAYTVAASAIEGQIADPRPYLVKPR